MAARIMGIAGGRSHILCLNSSPLLLSSTISSVRVASMFMFLDIRVHGYTVDVFSI